jgi:hypothetical protein
MVNKITTVLDIDDRGFSASLKKVGTSVGEADGLFNKLKAGGSAAFDGLKQNAGLFAVGAGAAIAAFGVKAVGAFTDTAKAAIDLSTSTGLSIEAASRWIALGDDYQVTGEALATGLGKISKTMDDTKWEKYGIDTRDAGGHARAVNDILLDTFDKLSGISNETERARVGQELFGKGYQSLTPILGHTREEYEGLLAAQKDGQVITAEEAKKAEKMRLAFDEFSDSVGELALSFGGLVAAAEPALTVVAKGVQAVADGIGALTGTDAKSVAGPIKEFAAAMEIAKEGTNDTLEAFLGLVDASGKARSTADQSGSIIKILVGDASGDEGRTSAMFDDIKKAIGELAAVAPDQARAVQKELMGIAFSATEGDEASADLAHTMGLTIERVHELGNIIHDTTKKIDEHAVSTLTAKEKADELRLKQEESAKAYAEYAAKVKEANDRQRDLINTQLDALGKQGDLEQQVRDTDSAYFDLTQKIAENTLKQQESELSDAAKKDSARDVASEVHTAAEKVLELSAAYGTEGGAAQGSKEAHDRQRDALVRAAEKYPELRAQIEEYIRALDRIPTTKTVTVEQVFHSPGSNIKWQAHGGVGEKGVTLRGEAGPELTYDSGTRVTLNAAQTEHNLKGASSAAGVQIVNNFNGVTDPREMARVQAREFGWALRAS